MTSTDVTLDVAGMTCASCATRIERKLNRIDGVTASVNFATERASVKATDVAISTLIAAVQAAGYSATVPVPVDQSSQPEHTAVPVASRHDLELAAVRQRLTVSAIMTVPVVLLSMISPLQFDNWQWLAFALAAPVSVWGAWPFHRAAAVNARHGAATMDTLISVGVLAAFGWSVFALFFGTAGRTGMHMTFSLRAPTHSGASEIYLEVATAVTVFILAGRFIEMRTKKQSGAALAALLELGAKDANVLRGDSEFPVAAAALAVGDIIVVRPGEKIAADGIIVEGRSAIDRSLLTGESTAIDVGPEDRVVGATINVGGRLLIEVTRVGADTELARMGRLVDEAQNGKAQVQRLADRVSAIFVPVVLVLAAATFVGWMLATGSLSAAFTAAVATLIIACPCALGLATPTALLVGTGRGSQLGIILRGPQILEQTRTIDTIVLDKTGTVTTGVMSVIEVRTVSGRSVTDVLRIAAAAEVGSEHPIGRAIVAYGVAAAEAPLPKATEFTAHAGLGVAAVIGAELVVVGRPSWLHSAWAAEIAPDSARWIAEGESRALTVIAVGVDGELYGLISVGDAIKTSSRAAIEQFTRLGLNAILLTGDNLGAATAIATQVAISTVYAEVTPEQKLRLIRKLQAEGHAVAMVGDGVNDAAALAAADLGIAMGSGTDTAIAASDITIVSNDLMAVADAVRLARRTLRTIKGNLFWAFAYNVAALPIAMLGLLNPVFAGAAMAVSSVFVVTNSLRLRRFTTSR